MSRAPKKESPEQLEAPEDGLTKRHAFGIATMMIIAMLTFMIAFGIIGYSYLKYQYIHAGPTTAEQVFEIPKGAGLSTIAGKLDKDGVIKSAFIFKTFVKLDGGETSLKAGEYIVPAQASMQDIYGILKDGKAILYPITIAEGLTSAQIMRQIGAADNIPGEVPEAPKEGTLLPETYMLPKTMTKTQLVMKMQKAQTDLVDELWEERAEGLPIKTKEEALILASYRRERNRRAQRAHPRRRRVHQPPQQRYAARIRPDDYLRDYGRREIRART